MYLKCNAANCGYVSEDHDDMGRLILQVEMDGGKVSMINGVWSFQCPKGHGDYYTEIKEVPAQK